MKRFGCPTCDAVLFFDSETCEACGERVAYDLESDQLTSLGGVECVHRDDLVNCNWLAPGGVGACVSCALDTVTTTSELCGPFQAAKRRTLRQLRRLGVPLAQPPQLRFALLMGTDAEPVMTGHEDGLITLDIAEGDRTHIEAVREQMGEPYRTPLGHVRHELGHWFWQAFVDEAFSTESFRAVFGDESRDYGEALATHYGAGDDGSWTAEYISHYAAAHPWEDFAESFAHLLHIHGTLETAESFGLVSAGTNDFEDVYRRWVDCTTALNELNRSMGTPDAYPFVVSQPAVDKIRFIAATIAAASTTTSD